MKLARSVWRLLVGIKDALVLVLLLLFFGGLYAALAARPGGKGIQDGALVLRLDGAIVEQPTVQDGLAALSGQGVGRQYRLRDVLRALDAARTDDRVKAVVLDLDAFGGAYPAALGEVGDALRRVRDGGDGAKGKPVLAYATAYTDGAYRLASNASEIWIHPMGGTLFTGPGGSQLYYKGLIDKLGANVHVYRVGRYKSFVEPYTRADQSPDARAANQALDATLLAQWKEAVAHARPRAQVDQFMAQPDKAVAAAGGDAARADLNAGLVDRLGDRIAFGKRVAALVGHGRATLAGGYDQIRWADWLAAHPASTGGDAIGVLTVAGDIVDGKAPAGTAGGTTLVKAVLDGLAKKNLKALVVRVDSPGGSALASEQIRLAIEEAKRQGLPVVTSMGGLAASGGYWVSTAGDAIFAEPGTITGSIGIFAVIPTFENTLAKIGVTADGVKTTPLSGQPDLFAGTNPVLDSVLQAGIDHGYREFVGRVSAARHLSPARVDEIGQGRVWDGGTGRQIGLVDRFGGLDDAIREAARRAKLDPAKVHAVYLEPEPSWWSQLFAGRDRDDDDDAAVDGDLFARAAASQRELLARALGDMKRLALAGSVQARCLQCGGLGPATPAPGDAHLVDLVLAKLGW